MRAALRGRRALVRPERPAGDPGRLMEVAVPRPRRGRRQDRRRSRRGGLHGERLGSRAAARRDRRTPAARSRRSRGADVVLSVNAAGVALDVGGGRRARARRRRALRRPQHRLAAAEAGARGDALRCSSPTSRWSASCRAPAFARRRSRPVTGAARFAELFEPLGMPVEVVGPEAGDAAGLKLLRSVFMKGVAAAALESLAAAACRRRRGARPRRHRGGDRRAAARAVRLRVARPCRAPRRRDARRRRVPRGARRAAARGDSRRPRCWPASTRTKRCASSAPSSPRRVSRGRAAARRSPSGSTAAPRA